MNLLEAECLHPGQRSLRSRWNRAFALLTATVVLSGLAAFLGTHLLVQDVRSSAVGAERRATISSELRADLVAYAVAVTEPITAAQTRRTATIALAVRSEFTRAIANEVTVRPKQLLEESLQHWQVMVAATGVPDHPHTVATRGAAVAARIPGVLSLLDQAGVRSRADLRTELASAARSNRATMVLLGLLELFTIALAVRLARRLTSEVLVPVGVLRESVNQLAAGDLDHRVPVGRVDELGDLAISFNAMADAIAESQRSLSREANSDSLSGLANRAAFRTRLEATLTRPQRRRGDQAVLFVDLDDFKDVNDTLGHAAGDHLLRVVSGRLIEAVRPGDLVARLGGDEFALLLDGFTDSEDAFTLAERVVTVLAEAVEIDGRSVHVGASVGMAVRHDDSTLDRLMREADVAMYAAKGNGKNRVERYDAELDDMAIARHLLRADVADAADRGELVVDYQPVIHLETGELIGLEALVRWQHPTRGLLPPSEFIDLAEETGAIISLGGWVMETAARQLQRWQRRYGLPNLWISVNVSVCQLDVPNFAEAVVGILSTAGLDPGCVVLEVTESVLADPNGEAPAALAALRKIGLRVALDDFGTGYSSIGYLRQLPIDVLKIDRSFVVDTDSEGRGNAVLGAIVAMAQSLGLDVIPEGIEEFDQLSRLRAMGCHIGQGFLLSRPLSSDAIDSLLSCPMPLPHVALFESVHPFQSTPSGAGVPDVKPRFPGEALAPVPT